MCTITATFTPVGRGARTATITLTDDAADSPESIAFLDKGCCSRPPPRSRPPASRSLSNSWAQPAPPRLSRSLTTATPRWPSPALSPPAPMRPISPSPTPAALHSPPAPTARSAQRFTPAASGSRSARRSQSQTMLPAAPNPSRLSGTAQDFSLEPHIAYRHGDRRKCRQPATLRHPACGI